MEILQFSPSCNRTRAGSWCKYVWFPTRSPAQLLGSLDFRLPAVWQPMSLESPAPKQPDSSTSHLVVCHKGRLPGSQVFHSSPGELPLSYGPQSGWVWALEQLSMQTVPELGLPSLLWRISKCWQLFQIGMKPNFQISKATMKWHHLSLHSGNDQALCSTFQPEEEVSRQQYPHFTEEEMTQRANGNSTWSQCKLMVEPGL